MPTSPRQSPVSLPLEPLPRTKPKRSQTSQTITTLASTSDVPLIRSKSLVRPERRRINRDHPQYHYRQRAQAQQLEIYNSPVINDDIEGQLNDVLNDEEEGEQERIEEEEENITTNTAPIKSSKKIIPPKQEILSIWILFCHIVTCCFPRKVLALFNITGYSRIRAWREKMGLLAIVCLVCALVAFATFGFSQAVCNIKSLKFKAEDIPRGYLIIHGTAYDLTRSLHPGAIGIPPGANVLYPPVSAGGMDASFLFQNVNQNCKGLISLQNGSSIPFDSQGNVGWYFPCRLYKLDGTSVIDRTPDPYPGYACHTSANGRNSYYDLRVQGEIYYSWEDLKDTSRNLVTYSGSVLDLNLLEWIDDSQIVYPSLFNDLRNGTINPLVRGRDITHMFASGYDKRIAQCLEDIIKVGSIDSDTIGCVASKVVLYISLVFIASVVLAKFLLALIFDWILSRRLGMKQDKKEMRRRQQEIENWTEDIMKPAPGLKSNRRASVMFLPTKSRFTNHTNRHEGSTNRRFNDNRRSDYFRPRSNAFDNRQSLYRQSTYQTEDLYDEKPTMKERLSTFMSGDSNDDYIELVHNGVVQQPEKSYEPFGFPLSHVIITVTAYSESYDGIRTTLDSVATTDYPNSHKVIVVLCDGQIRGRGNTQTTPDFVLSMLTDVVTPIDQVQQYSYVAIANGLKRQNKAKIYAGFYLYDDKTVDPSLQQRVPMIVVSKTGVDEEKNDKKPGNRGKRDSQVILMSFLQKVMFDERMSELDYELFTGFYRITGLKPSVFEMVLMVDADTKIYPDSVSHMVSCMVRDPTIMGVCGETKIANKRASWVTMIQVYEYYISHHLNKAFESVFGGVTCLPGCFTMYRIKTPKGAEGYFVPILANPDVVEHYSENIVDTLHKKNLYLLGEDRYLTTLMLKTFPKRRHIFLPNAVCKTVVPESFSVLLSQRRRWINSTVHNLMELLLVRDLCGTFCFSMQFVIFMELIGTLVLPAAVGFMLYIIIASAITRPVPVIPLCILALVIGLPGLLIIITARSLHYLGYMLIYLLALPIWNMVLPIYAYWHFDDFGWGETRRVEGELKEAHHGENEGEFDSSRIKMKHWKDFEMEKRKTKRQNGIAQLASQSSIDHGNGAWQQK